MTNRIRKTLDVKLVDLTAKAVDGWLMRMSDNYRPATIQSSFVVLKLSCTNAVTHGILLSNPCDEVRFKKAAREAGVPDIRIHDLRHTHATHALRIGTPIGAVSKRLGHKNPTTIMNLYAHVLKDMEMNVTRSVDELFAAAPRAENQ